MPAFLRIANVAGHGGHVHADHLRQLADATLPASGQFIHEKQARRVRHCLDDLGPGFVPGLCFRVHVICHRYWRLGNLARSAFHATADSRLLPVQRTPHQRPAGVEPVAKGGIGGLVFGRLAKYAIMSRALSASALRSPLYTAVYIPISVCWQQSPTMVPAQSLVPTTPHRAVSSHVLRGNLLTRARPRTRLDTISAYAHLMPARSRRSDEEASDFRSDLRRGGGNRRGNEGAVSLPG